MNHPSSRAIDRAAPIVAILAIAIMAALSLAVEYGSGPDAMYARSWVAGTTLVRRSYAF